MSPKLFFCNFLKFVSLVLLEREYNDSLQQYLTSSGGKYYKKKFGGPNLGQTGQNWAQTFLPFSQVWFISFPLNCIG